MAYTHPEDLMKNLQKQVRWPFPTESLIMAPLFSQHKLIEWLEGRISRKKTSVLNPLDQSLNEISHNYRLRISV
ncbi:MAG: hypothetical protein DLM72_06555 [Candidatus Nitrosopolaris wilkensis]|nr:MAG: hypothetical protein DLM72_06555 [Candidatus Nitrosopolaris wilkensis]